MSALEKPVWTDSEFTRIRAATEIVQAECNALQRLAHRIPADFSPAVDLLLACRGAVIVTGIGKAGWIGQKLSASFASTGTRSHFLHPAEAIHGDLGRIADDDVIVALSNSGESGELLQILPSLHKRSVPIIAITADTNNSLARASHFVLDFGRVAEAGHLGLAPSTTTSAMLAMGDALALVVSQARAFTSSDFAQFHPGGSLGRKLASVDEIMRPLDQCRTALTSDTVREIYIRNSQRTRRMGVILVLDAAQTLAGVFTDSDLARLLERRRDQALDRSIAEVMTANPISIESGSRASEAIAVLAERNISELPVVDEDRRPLGIIDITDVIGLLPVPA